MSPRRNNANSIGGRSRIGLVGFVLIWLLLSTLSTNEVKAEEYVTGGVSVDCNLSGVGTGACSLAFIKGASYGVDSFDGFYEEVPGPWDMYVKAIGSIDGRPAVGIANPPLPKVSGSSGGASFSCSFVVGEGKTVVLDNAHYSFSASGSIDGCKVYVNGVDLSESTDIPGGEISGTFGPGEYSIGDIDISVVYEGTGGNGGNGDDDNGTVEPNTPLDAGPHILRIDNVHERMPATTFKFILKQGATDGPNDVGDIPYTNFTGIPPPFIVSEVGDKLLSQDVRGTDSKPPVYFNQTFYSDTGVAFLGGKGDINALVFSFPSDETNNKFGNRILTFQEYIPDANEPNLPTPDPNAPKSFPDPNAETFPVYDIRELIADGNGFGTVLLPNFERYIYTGTLHNFILRTDSISKELAVGDFNKDSMVDINDCNALTLAMGHTGNCVYDIASADVNDPNVLYIGIRPDGIVDESDVKAIYQLMGEDTKRREEITAKKESDEEIGEG